MKIKDYPKWDRIAIVILIICSFLLEGMVIYLLLQEDNNSCNCESCNMRFDRNNSVGVNGVYSSEGYFCVWTKDKSMNEIMRVTYHELFHMMVNEERFKEEKEHFKVLEDGVLC